MKKKACYLFLLALLLSCGSGNEVTGLSDDQRILYALFEQSEIQDYTEVILQCDKKKLKTFVPDSLGSIVKDESIPNNVLIELETNSKSERSPNTWKPGVFDRAEFKTSLLKSSQCYSKENINTLFERVRKRQYVVEVSQPLYDNKKSYSFVHIVVQRYPGSSYGSSFLLQKVDGKWTVIAQFDHWLS